MVPNHMGIDSRWVVEHPEWFLSLPEPPYPGYTFGGENVAENDRVEIRLEDHYWDNSDAAVVFERRDRWSGERRYIYHGNDGTSFPWNDTAQLDFSKAAVREQVIRTIVDVARRFPVIRFDAAMVLAKKHVRRLWFPGPGEGGGAIPSRAEYGTMSQAAFDAAMPLEFWREVVDRVAVEAPDTPAAGGGVLAARGLLRPDPRHAPRLQLARSCTCSATRTTRATGGCSRRPSSSTRRSSSATSTS